MDPFLAQLKDLCRAQPTRAKWVFVPTHAIGRTIGDRLALSGTDWANLRFVTPLDIALRMGAPFLVERGIDPSEEGLGPALVMRLLLGLPEENGYFRPLASQPQMALALWRTLRELRLAGVKSEHFSVISFASSKKGIELRDLVAAYERFLAETARGDMATVFAEAATHLDWCPIQPDDCWTELPDAVWSKLQRRLIDAMPGERIVPVTIELPGLDVPRRLREASVERRAPGGEAPLAFLGSGLVLTHPGARPGTPDSGAGAPAALSLFSAGGPEAEVEEVFRRILTAGVSLDDAEIVCASPQYSTLIWEKAMRHEWPVTLAQGLPAALTRPGRALLALTEWIEDNFAAGRLRRMLQSGDLRMGDDASISTGRAARLLVKAQAAWGRETYRLSLGRLAKSSRTGAARDDLPQEQRDGLEARAKQADELARWIGQIIAAVPVPAADGNIDLQALVEGACAFVDRTAARASALDALAAKSLTESIGELRSLGDFRCPLGQALRFLRERVEGLHIGADRPRPGHLYVSSLATAGYAGRSRIFVVGLEEGRVFPVPFEDPILLDSERERISPALQTSSDRIDEAVSAALGRLAALSADPLATISLSYSCQDVREYRPTYASWLLLQAYRVVSRNPAASYRDLHEHLGTPKSCVPESAAESLAASRWWLHGMRGAEAAARPYVLDHYRPLHAGVVAAEKRQSSDFTEYDGFVPAAGPVLDPFNGNRVLSPTQLEDAAKCPFRHFLKRGLGVDAIEGGERDRDVWLDPLLRGSLLHDLYAELLRRSRAAGRRVTAADDRDWLIERGREVLAELAVEMPPPSDEVQEREADLFLDDLALFVDAEASLDPSHTPVGFEVAFGRADSVDDEPLAQAEPVVIDVGGGLKLRVAGRIDRIDRVGPSSYEIIDYKTGSYFPDDWTGTFAGGTRLQHALYGLAAAEMLRRQDRKARTVSAQYYFSSRKGTQQRKQIPAPSMAATSEVLNDLRSVIASGLFVHAPNEKACMFCDYGNACGQNAHERAEAKRGDWHLTPFAKLVDHE